MPADRYPEYNEEKQRLQHTQDNRCFVGDAELRYLTAGAGMERSDG